MQWKNIILAGFLGFIWLIITLQMVGIIGFWFSPYNPEDFNYLRAIPLSTIFIPFILAFVASFLFDIIQESLKGNTIQKGLKFGAILILVWGVRALTSSVTIVLPKAQYLAIFFEYLFIIPILGILIAFVFDYKFDFEKAPPPLKWIKSID